MTYQLVDLGFDALMHAAVQALHLYQKIVEYVKRWVSNVVLIQSRDGLMPATQRVVQEDQSQVASTPGEAMYLHHHQSLIPRDLLPARHYESPLSIIRKCYCIKVRIEFRVNTNWCMTLN